MSKRRKEAEVIVFEEPKFKKRKSEKELCRGADVSQLFSSKPPPRRDGASSKPQRQQAEELDFKATLREVQKYAVSSLSGTSKRRREEEQVLALGGKPAKNEKMPYPLYMKRVKAQKKKERRERRDCLLGGMPVPKKRERHQKRGKGRWKETTRSIKPHVGTSTRDGLVLSHRDISRVKKSSAPRKHS
jgi:hypothetical protein